MRQVIKQLLEGKSASDVFLSTTLDSTMSLAKIKELELIVQNEQPVVKFDSQQAGKAAVINYNIPSSTSYSGLNYVILDHPKLRQNQQFEWFVKPGGIPQQPGSTTQQPPPHDVNDGGEPLWTEYRTRFKDLNSWEQEEIYRRLEQTAAVKGIPFYDITIVRLTYSWKMADPAKLNEKVLDPHTDFQPSVLNTNATINMKQYPGTVPRILSVSDDSCEYKWNSREGKQIPVRVRMAPK